ncbi:hypothetical protein DICSQDRAFT_70041 [Dichomitus squalens LYAD-421 SS1]|uniref:Uncharacterized protein n=1 Tax=Dichomitus squalens (strain LYAD-421) TaxID=732165 RepID=R7SNB8_DICSQ|nr:uncharacterized protein DICSQDRAFT_70041 [Dichomitus squalens LYAD-421 SS1]EJF57185.1 hypothetical protein DICSQDRAFT_70041 [Dichomitus squalens LYAD-421 SS1]
MHQTFWRYSQVLCVSARTDGNETRRPCPQGDPAVCTGFGSCTVSIFPCPASALGLGRPFIFDFAMY